MAEKRPGPPYRRCCPTAGCGRLVPPSVFPLNSLAKTCRRCRGRAAQKRYAEKHPDRVKRSRSAYRRRNLRKVRERDRHHSLKKRYGISLDDYRAMLSSQGGRCAICRGTRTARGRELAVDHCHKTGRVRGILCVHCNVALGQARDRVDVLRAMIRYLRKWGRKTRHN